jgi:hypothetical protein
MSDFCCPVAYPFALPIQRICLAVRFSRESSCGMGDGWLLPMPHAPELADRLRFGTRMTVD